MEIFLCLLFGFLGGAIAFLIVALVIGMSAKKKQKQKADELKQKLGEFSSMFNINK